MPAVFTPLCRPHFPAGAAASAGNPPKDGWQSGRLRTPGKRVYRKVTGVRIPPIRHSEGSAVRCRERVSEIGDGRVRMGTEFEVVVRPRGDGVLRGPAFPKRCADFGNERQEKLGVPIRQAQGRLRLRSAKPPFRFRMTDSFLRYALRSCRRGGPSPPRCRWRCGSGRSARCGCRRRGG